ncbi:MAG TPA: glucose-1-phosphate adenylyltransferase [Thermoanaerobaculia bacterium]|nr:glucose-1-phosphate adenylyltransferase [Thermoanaerobaculia bacterium]
MKSVVTAILGGGQGTRLFPLTRHRAKPAVPVGGKFRLIDIPISNSLHAAIDRIYVLTQFNSTSLHRHIAQTYRFDTFRGGFVNILAAEQNLTNRDWYQGTADAVRQNLSRFIEPPTSEVLILSGDQLYMMDLEEFVTYHREKQADLTIAVKPVGVSEASSFGILQLARTGQVVNFAEKPKDPALLEELALDEATQAALPTPAPQGSFLASMGIYVFKPQVLEELLAGTLYADFGREVIPEALSRYRVFAYPYHGYWADIGTIPSFHQANLDLTLPLPPVDLYSSEFPIFTHARFLPGAKITQCLVNCSILCEGSIITGARVADSVIGIRSVVRSGSVIERSVLMGAGFFEHIEEAPEIPLGVGHDCHLRNVIVDTNARIGDGSRLVNVDNVQEYDGENYSIHGGVIVIPKGAVIPPGTVI